MDVLYFIQRYQFKIIVIIQFQRGILEELPKISRETFKKLQVNKIFFPLESTLRIIIKIISIET